MTPHAASSPVPPTVDDGLEPSEAAILRRNRSRIHARLLRPSPPLAVDDLRRPLARALDDEFEQLDLGTDASAAGGSRMPRPSAHHASGALR
jgi:hypothetical protein